MYSTQKFDGFTVVTIDLSQPPINGSAATDDLSAYIASFPDVDFQGGVILSGRAPIWLMSALCHQCHPARWVGTFDPRLGGGVVISRHHKSAPAIGDIVAVPDAG